jgi:hypothetical protein
LTTWSVDNSETDLGFRTLSGCACGKSIRRSLGWLGMTELEWDRECLSYVRDNTVELVVLSLQTLPQIVAESSGRLLSCAGAKAWLR